MEEKEEEPLKEVPFHDNSRKEVIDKLLELHRQLILLEQLDGESKIPFLRKIVRLRDFFWDLDIEEYLYANGDLWYIYRNQQRLMEKLRIYKPFPKWSFRKPKL